MVNQPGTAPSAATTASPAVRLLISLLAVSMCARLLRAGAEVMPLTECCSNVRSISSSVYALLHSSSFSIIGTPSLISILISISIFSVSFSSLVSLISKLLPPLGSSLHGYNNFFCSLLRNDFSPLFTIHHRLHRHHGERRLWPHTKGPHAATPD